MHSFANRKIVIFFQWVTIMELYSLYSSQPMFFPNCHKPSTIISKIWLLVKCVILLKKMLKLIGNKDMTIISANSLQVRIFFQKNTGSYTVRNVVCSAYCFLIKLKINVGRLNSKNFGAQKVGHNKPFFKKLYCNCDTKIFHLK